MNDKIIDTAIGIDLLKDAGYNCFVAFFYGGGDSGEFEESHVIPREFVCEETGDLLIDRHDGAFTEGVQKTPELPDQIQDAIPSRYYQDHDWWNNEGGSGYIVVDLEKMKYYTHYDLNHEDESEYPIDEDGKKLELCDDGEPDWDNHCAVYRESSESGCGDFKF